MYFILVLIEKCNENNVPFNYSSLPRLPKYILLLNYMPFFEILNSPALEANYLNTNKMQIKSRFVKENSPQNYVLSFSTTLIRKYDIKVKRKRNIPSEGMKLKRSVRTLNM